MEIFKLSNSSHTLSSLVNCGMMFIVAIIKGEDWSNFSLEYESTNPWFVDKIGEIVGRAPNFSQVGIMSLLLTIANVIMVALGSCLMFRAKEVLPVKKKVFWDDLKVSFCPIVPHLCRGYIVGTCCPHNIACYFALLDCKEDLSRPCC